MKKQTYPVRGRSVEKSGSGAKKKRKPDSADTQIGESIRAHRLILGMSQSDLAERLGVSFQQVQKYEKGANRIGAGRLPQIAEILSIPISALFAGHTETPSDKAKGSAAPVQLITDPSAVKLLTSYADISDRRDPPLPERTGGTDRQIREERATKAVSRNVVPKHQVPPPQSEGTAMSKNSTTEIDALIGERVRSLRLRTKTSQAVLGEALGVTFQQIQKYETGANRIGCARLFKIAEVLGCDVTEFYQSIKDGQISARTPFSRFMATKDGVAIVEAMLKIEDQALRRVVIEIAEKLADTQIRRTKIRTNVIRLNDDHARVRRRPTDRQQPASTVGKQK